MLLKSKSIEQKPLNAEVCDRRGSFVLGLFSARKIPFSGRPGCLTTFAHSYENRVY